MSISLQLNLNLKLGLKIREKKIKNKIRKRKRENRKLTFVWVKTYPQQPTLFFSLSARSSTKAPRVAQVSAVHSSCAWVTGPWVPRDSHYPRARPRTRWWVGRGWQDAHSPRSALVSGWWGRRVSLFPPLNAITTRRAQQPAWVNWALLPKYRIFLHYMTADQKPFSPRPSLTRANSQHRRERTPWRPDLGRHHNSPPRLRSTSGGWYSGCMWRNLPRY